MGSATVWNELINDTGRGTSAHSSQDFRNWKREAPVFSEKSEWTDKVVSGFKNHLWAPDIFLYNNTWYLYYSVSAFGKNTSAIGVARNSTLYPQDESYHWEDQGIVLQSVPNRDMWNAFDPNIIMDEEGTAWMSFGSFWNGLKLVKLDENLTSLSNPEEWYIIARRERYRGLSDANAGDAALEARFIFRKNGYYYLFLSWNLCCRGDESTHKVGRSQEVTGPYLDWKGKPTREEGRCLWKEMKTGTVLVITEPTSLVGKIKFFSYL